MDSLRIQSVLISKELDSYYQKNKKNSKLQTITSAVLQANIAKDTQVIQYFMGLDNVFAFSITKDKLRFLKLGNIKNIQLKIKNLQDKIRLRASFTKTSNSLYDILLANLIEKNKKKLQILSDGNINYIPFELLQHNNKPLIYDYSIVYYPALSLIQPQTKPIKYKEFWTGFSVSGNDNNLISATSSEIKEIQKITKGTGFFNKNVKKDSIFLKAKTSKIVHLAVHGKLNTKNPLYSELVLADDKITASDIYHHKIKSDLVVLSACETASGKNQNGEGVLSLSRAFTFSGAKSTLTSLWKVPDKETQKIMQLFYKYLLEGKSKSQALQQAKMEYLKNTTDISLKHPFYWAGFVLQGNDSAIVKAPINYYWLLGGFMVIILALLFLRNKD